jgi:hypothetical protein
MYGAERSASTDENVITRPNLRSRMPGTKSRQARRTGNRLIS